MKFSTKKLRESVHHIKTERPSGVGRRGMRPRSLIWPTWPFCSNSEPRNVLPHRNVAKTARDTSKSYRTKNVENEICYNKLRESMCLTLIVLTREASKNTSPKKREIKIAEWFPDDFSFELKRREIGARYVKNV